MGYQIVAGRANETLSDEVWLDLIALAAKHGYSTPGLGQLGRNDDTDLTEEETAGLYAALERAPMVSLPRCPSLRAILKIGRRESRRADLNR